MLRLEDFMAHVVQSGLVEPDVLDRVHSEVALAGAGDDKGAGGEGQADGGDGPTLALARRLISDRLLTSFQARKLLAGRTSGFFLGGWRLLRPLGAGGMGKVYLAENDRDERVAVKVLPPRKAVEDQNALLRFQREMDLSRRFAHPNVARTLEVGNEGDVYFMVMEHVPGESLFEMVKGGRVGPLRVPDAARLFLQLIDGLDAAHQAGLVHRDIKPSNLMITPAGTVKLLDLGLARALNDERGLTRANTVLGTLDYASPEQIRDATRADRRSDLYSVGCTLYFALAGRAPFEGGDMINKIFRQRMEDPDPLESVARGVPSAFAAIVRKLMNKNPEERYQNCAELRHDLARWTDPRRAAAILGAEAEAARHFHPPPPELDESDLRFIDLESSGGASFDLPLRSLGDAEPSHAPRHQPPRPPLRALARSAAPRAVERAYAPRNENDWLLHFALIACALGVVAVVIIALWFHD